MKKLFIFIFIFCQLKMFCQTKCNCSEIIKNAIETVENNYGIFMLKPELQNSIQYKTLCNELLLEAKKSEIPCEAIFMDYITFFKDKHFTFSGSPLFGTYKKKYYTKNELKSFNDLIGIWQLTDKPYFIRVFIKDGLVQGKVIYDWGEKVDTSKINILVYKNYFNNYTMVLKENQNTYATYQFVIKDKALFEWNNLLFKKVNKVTLETKNIAKKAKLEFKLIDSNSFYIKVPELVYLKKEKFDSILKIYDSVIVKTKNLIIDFRDNLGGQITPLMGLRKYVYTGPFRFQQSYILASDSIIKLYKSIIDDTTNKNYFYYESFIKLHDSLVANKGKLVFQPDSTYLQPTILTYPKNVALLINRNTASAAEMLVYGFSLSKKATIFGEYSMGYIKSGSAIEYKVCDWTLYIPSEIGETALFSEPDLTGLRPNIFLGGNENSWLAEILKYYKN